MEFQLSEVKTPEDFNLFNQMCHEILIADEKKGPARIALLKDILMKPVFIFNKDTHLSAGIEGRNEFIRAMINGAHQFMNHKLKDGKVKNVNRTRREVITND